MPGLYIRASKFKLDAGKFTQTLETAVKTQMRQSARRFVETALYEGIKGGVPVDTGMAAGTYLNIGRMLRIAINILPINTKPKKYYGDNAYGEIKSPELGASLATRFNSLETIIKKEGNLFYFEFQTSVFHYTLLDLFGIRQNPNSPWQTFQTGKDAFINYMRTEGIKRLPKVTEFIERSVLEVNPSGGIRETKVQSDTTSTISPSEI